MIVATPPAAGPATTPSASHELGVRVLVVDDDVTNRQVATLMLARLGVVADPVATGLDAVAAAGRGGHRLVLLDLHLPDVDGAEVARGRVPRTLPFRFSLDESFDVGADTGTPVTDAYRSPNTFGGTLRELRIEPVPR